MTLSVYVMPGEAGAFEAVQRFPTKPNQTAFYEDEYFGIAVSATVDVKILGRFAVTVKSALRTTSNGKLYTERIEWSVSSTAAIA